MSISVSTNDPQITPPAPAANPPVSWAQGRGASSLWVWMTLACMLLGASGGVRAWQDRRFATVEEYVSVSPFPLKDLPQTLGDWRAQEGKDTSLDPEVARMAGSSDHLVRTYVHASTAQSLTVLILFGPAKIVYGHQPAVCYPMAGYRSVAETLTRLIPIGARPAAAFYSQVYARQRDQQWGRQEVYFSFRHGDRWYPDPSRFWKDFRHHPSMFKVQTQRLVMESELSTARREQDNPTEQFLARLLPEIERRVAQAPRDSEG
jgi:Protein of unknown function (DUF3485)